MGRCFSHNMKPDPSWWVCSCGSPVVEGFCSSICHPLSWRSANTLPWTWYLYVNSAHAEKGHSRTRCYQPTPAESLGFMNPISSLSTARRSVVIVWSTRRKTTLSDVEFYCYRLTWIPDISVSCFKAAVFPFDGTQIQYSPQSTSRKKNRDSTKEIMYACVWGYMQRHEQGRFVYYQLIDWPHAWLQGKT